MHTHVRTHIHANHTLCHGPSSVGGVSLFSVSTPTRHRNSPAVLHAQDRSLKRVKPCRSFVLKRWRVCAAAEGASKHGDASAFQDPMHTVCLLYTGITPASGTPKTMTIPIFPLGVVALPAANVPLRIFEVCFELI